MYLVSFTPLKTFSYFEITVLSTQNRLILKKLPNGASIRMVKKDGVMYISAIDLIAIVMGIKTSDSAKKIFYLINHKVHGPTMIKLLERKHKFPGMGQKSISVWKRLAISTKVN